MIEGKETMDDGEIKVGGNIKTAFYSQTQEDFSQNTSILNFIWNQHSSLTQTEVRKALALFLFKGEEVEKSILSLSGGEKARLALLQIMLSQSNFLILDEPTNHLDINAREALENALMEYDGTLFIVSHDRYFMNKLATKIYRLEASGVTEYQGNYDSYLEKYLPRITQVVKKESANKVAYKEKKEKEALERKRKNQLLKLENEIAVLEEENKRLGDELLKEENAINYEKAMEITNQVEINNKKLEQLYLSWEELCALITQSSF